MGVHNLQSSTEFKETLVNSGYKAVLVDCFSKDSQASKAIAPEIVKYSNDEKYQGILFAKLDVDQVPSLADELGVKDLPCLILYKNGEVVGRYSEPTADALPAFVDKAL
ncbi:thioredoxin domain-containing protein [Sarocladium implicatum]|nr:thioredoxin domain-containing protein [Sarocladium implicatum]